MKTIFEFLKLIKIIRAVFHTHKYFVRKEILLRGGKFGYCLTCAKCGKGKFSVVKMSDNS